MQSLGNPTLPIECRVDYIMIAEIAVAFVSMNKLIRSKGEIVRLCVEGVHAQLQSQGHIVSRIADIGEAMRVLDNLGLCQKGRGKIPAFLERLMTANEAQKELDKDSAEKGVTQ